MPNYPIDLGKSMSSPSAPLSVVEKPNKEKYYPCLYLDWDEKYDLPSEGVMEVRFKKKSETTRNYEGKTTQSVELEIQEILDVESTGTKEKEETADRALDRYRNESK
jgi:hypothetical protein